ncbi:MAG: NADH-quinone oxidoreductase subunit NuoN [Gammaproteobacteria bacterium]|nr:NADH-quinone oxidoreductase subunit NuoN [Gammaproteobacteria bacterium]
MSYDIPNLVPAFPEMIVFSLGTLALLVQAFWGQKRPIITYAAVQLTILIAAVFTLGFINEPTMLTFDNTFILDKFAVILKLFIELSVFLCFFYSRVYLADNDMPRGEYYILGLFAMLGMMVLVSSHHFLTLYLGVELMSLPVYAMVAMKRESGMAAEAAMKYFIIGAMASGMLLYGISMIYGATNNLDFSLVASAIANTAPEQQLILIFGLAFVMVGIAFKLGAVPFHMWLPDVYEGAPNAVTLFIASAPKIAALGMVIRLLVDAMPSLHIQWQQDLIAIAVLSMALGNFAAIVQANIKRMLAYSSIAHMGYMILGVIAANNQGYAASTFYIITYSLMTLGSFGLLVLMSRAGYEVENIADFKGLNNRNPWLAFIMLIMMFSMAGVPPLVGFWAKVGVLKALIQVDLVWLAALALLFAIVGAYYYIRVVKVMYFEEPDSEKAYAIPKDMQIALTINGLAVLVLGLFPGWLFELCKSAF